MSILDAPSSVEDSIIDSKYQSIFESELGSNRFNGTDVLIQNSGITRDEGLSVIRETSEYRTSIGYNGSMRPSPVSIY